jgi:hypothetical protein
MVESEQESTFEFMFTPSETFSQRQFGLVISLRYKDMDSKSFINSVFNETITIVEPEEGFDGETFFLYIFLAAIVVLLGLVGNHFLSGFTVFKIFQKNNFFKSRNQFKFAEIIEKKQASTVRWQRCQSSD